MSIGGDVLVYVLLLTAVAPAILAIRLAAKQNRSRLTSAVVTFVLGFTWAGGWIYLAIMNLMQPKEPTQ